MKTTLNEALKVAKTGDWSKAWEIARQDEGLDGSTTFAEWKPFAERAIARRAAAEIAARQQFSMCD